VAPPQISVLVPSYNTAPWLRNMVKSVVRQTCKRWEMIIVDDGSEDETPLVLNKLLAEYSQYQISAALASHQGCAGALKMAVELTSAPLCTYVGADDTIAPDSLEVIVKAFKKHPKVGFIWTRYLAKREGARNWTRGRSKRLPKGKSLKQALLSGWWGALAQDCWRRSAYLKTPGLDPNLPFAVDQQVAMLFANLGCKVLHLPRVTYFHIQHHRQMSATHFKEQQKCRAEILRRLGGVYVREK